MPGMLPEGGPQPAHAADALIEPRRVPWQVEVHHDGRLSGGNDDTERQAQFVGLAAIVKSVTVTLTVRVAARVFEKPVVVFVTV